MNRFLVFSRMDRFEWALAGAYETLHVATHAADRILKEHERDRAVVMEVVGVDAMPVFIFKHRAVNKA